MSYGLANAQLHVECGDFCGARLHIFIERDNEQVPYARQVVVGPHQELIDALGEGLVGTYFDTVDDEAMWLIHPIEIGRVEDLAEKLIYDIAEAEEQEEEENISPT